MIYIDNVQDDTIAVAVASNASAVTQELEIDCFDGQTFSIDAATSLATVEFKQEDEVAWTAIESGVYDLSPFAGTRETFQLRFDPDAVGVEALRFRVGPAA